MVNNTMEGGRARSQSPLIVMPN